MRIAIAGGTGVVGRYVTEAAAAAGHEVVVLTRSTGMDIRSRHGLTGALAGVDVVVDTINSGTTDEKAATEFFTEAATNLQHAGAACGVRRLIVLSIVGIDRGATGYYRAKLAHEHAAAAGPIPSTIVRATQFHEFPAQLLRRSRSAVAHIPDIRVQTVAARAVGRYLVDVASSDSPERQREIAGPQAADLVELTRRFVSHHNMNVEVIPATRRDTPAGALLPGAEAVIIGPTFDEWLNTPDASRLI